MEVTRATAALVTGAGSGIGRAIALRLGELGARVTVVDISEAGGEETVRIIKEMRSLQEAELEGEQTGGCRGSAGAIFVQCDVACPTQLAKAFTAHMDAFHHLDICINNAGVAYDEDFSQPPRCGYGSDQTDVTDLNGEAHPLILAEDLPWKKTIDVNVVGVINGVRYAVDCMSRTARSKEDLNGGEGRRIARGVIVNVAAILGLHPFPPLPVLSASKAAVVMLTRCLAHLEKDRGIRVCAFCLGTVKTNIGSTITRTPALEEASKNVPAMGVKLSMETVVQGLMKLIVEDRNGGAILNLTPRDGCSYATTIVTTEEGLSYTTLADM